jgi:hypothetical protein
MTPEGITDALRGAEGGSFPPAPAHGLVLMDVIYDGLEFSSPQQFPRGTTERLRSGLHKRRSRLRYLEYLRDKVEY